MANATEIERPLDIVVRRLAKGSESELARMLGISRSSVSCWRSIKRRGDDMAGTIPGKYHRRILDLAAGMGIKLALSDLIGG